MIERVTDDSAYDMVGLAWPGRVQRPTIRWTSSVSPATRPETRRRQIPIIARGIPWLRHDPEVAAHA